MLVDEHETFLVLECHVRAPKLEELWNLEDFLRSGHRIGLLRNHRIKKAAARAGLYGEHCRFIEWPSEQDRTISRRRIEPATSDRCGRVECAECTTDCGLDGSLDRPLLEKPDLSLCRVNVHIHRCGRKRDREEHRRPQPRRNCGAICR